jgi:hypothetical protein
VPDRPHGGGIFENGQIWEVKWVKGWVVDFFRSRGKKFSRDFTTYGWNFGVKVSRAELEWFCFKYWEGPMWSMRRNLKYWYQLSICSRTEENQGKAWSNWPVAGPSGCELTSSHQSGVKYANPNISPYIAVALFENVYRFALQSFVFIHILRMSNEKLSSK